jgi:hypothetical protein
LIAGGIRQRLGDREPADLVIEFVAAQTCASDPPVARRELEVAITWPVRQHPQHVTQVDLWIEPVQSSRRDQREEVATRDAVDIAANEEPCVSTRRESPFILPVLASWRSFTIDGTRSSARRSYSVTVSIVGVTAARTAALTGATMVLLRRSRDGADRRHRW